jgi:hypothetical protein
MKDLKVCDVQLLRDLSKGIAVGALAWRLKNSFVALNPRKDCQSD